MLKEAGLVMRQPLFVAHSLTLRTQNEDQGHKFF
jgi:hypothetical protein